jgi:hypothetical protein
MTATGPQSTPQLVPPPSANDGFDGKLRCPSLADLVQLECLSGARAAIEVNSNGRIGRLFFEHGDLVHATTPNAVGEEAALEILSWSTGSFGDAEVRWSGRRTITMPWQQLVMRAAQAVDERGRGALMVPARSGSHVVALSSLRPPGLPSSIPPELLSSVPPRPARELVRGARVHESGRVLSSEGQVGEFVELAAYLKRLIALIGEDLQLDEFRELVWDRQTTRLTLHTAAGNTFVAIEAPRTADTTALRQRLEA